MWPHSLQIVDECLELREKVHTDVRWAYLENEEVGMDHK